MPCRPENLFANGEAPQEVDEPLVAIPVPDTVEENIDEQPENIVDPIVENIDV